MNIIKLIPAAMALAFAGCSSAPPSYGDRMNTRGENVSAIGKQWNSSNEARVKGESMIAKGLRMIENGKNEQAGGEQMIQDGQRLIADSKEQMLKSEEEYQKMRANPVTSPTQP